MPKEAKYIKAKKVFVTGIGCINVIKTLSRLIKKGEIKYGDRVINIGYAGSSCLPIGSIVQINKCHRLNKSKTVKEATFYLSDCFDLDNYECTTSDDFVEDGAFAVADMELAYICAFFDDVVSLKIISDNINLTEYNSFDSKKTWKKLNKIIKGVANED